MSGHTPTPWVYRPHHHDDWGWIRGPKVAGEELAPLVALARSGNWEDNAVLDQHRTNRTDPYEANGLFIVEAVNNHEALVEGLRNCVRAYELQDACNFTQQMRDACEAAAKLLVGRHGRTFDLFPLVGDRREEKCQ